MKQNKRVSFGIGLRQSHRANRYTRESTAAFCLTSEPFSNKDISFGPYYIKMPPSRTSQSPERIVSFSLFSRFCSRCCRWPVALVHFGRFAPPLFAHHAARPAPRRRNRSSRTSPTPTPPSQIDEAARSRPIHATITRPGGLTSSSVYLVRGWPPLWSTLS
jgi:hypothetical protein